jgi:hypothetical protein
MDDLFELLFQVTRQCRELGISDLVIAGDLFHSKAPSRTSHRLIMNMMSWLRLSEDLTVYVVPGNHDMQNDRYDSLGDTQPLGVLVQSGRLKVLNGWMPGQVLSEVYGVPWQQKWTDEAVREQLAVYRKGTPGMLVVTHAPLYPPGRELTFENYPAEKWADAMGNQGFCFYGHVHEPHGTWECGGVTFCNYGALSRGSLHEYNLTRQVGFTTWGPGTGFVFHPLVAKPAEQVFRLREREQPTDAPGRLDDFLTQVSSTSLQVMSVETVVEHMRSLGLAPEDIALAEELIEVAQHVKR